MTTKRRFPWTGLAAALCLLGLAVAPACAEDYVLGNEDEVAITVYLHPELERLTAVDANGNVSFPPVGEVKAAGLTPKQLGDRLAEKLSTYLRQTTSVTVTVRQFLSRSVYVSGAVSKPGRYGFERIPNLIEVIGRAGGALAGSDLSRVQVVRTDGEMRRTLAADVAGTLRDGSITNLPELKPGDTVVIPTGIGVDPLAVMGGGAAVLGMVTRPGLYPVGRGQDLWTVLAAAGGLAATGDLSNVRILTREGSAHSALRVNLKDVLQRGTKAAVLVREGDVVYVPSTTASALGKTFAGTMGLLGVTRELFQIAVLAQIYQNDGRP